MFANVGQGSAHDHGHRQQLHIRRFYWHFGAGDPT
jgi:hypothetical protein